MVLDVNVIRCIDLLIASSINVSQSTVGTVADLSLPDEWRGREYCSDGDNCNDTLQFLL